MAPITNTISTFIESQVPEFIRSDPNSGFIAFLEAYYEWMEQANSGYDIVNQSKQIPSYWDVDQTTDQFIQYFINDFLTNFPNDPALDERKLIKLSRQFYQKKGSANSIQFLFRVLYNKEADIFFPKQQVLRVSDGKWYQPKLLRIAIDPVLTANNFNYQQLVGRQGLGSISNASCVIESAAIAVDPSIGKAVLELYVSNINQNFLPLENLNVVFGYDSNNNALVFSERIINSLTGVQIAPPGYGGLKYKGKSSVYTGDPITFIGGLQGSDASAQPAVGYVNATSQGAITGITVQDGSFYYRPGTNTVVTVVNAPGDSTGGNANVEVGSIDTADSIFLLINKDSIYYKANTVLNVSNFGFANANSFGANINTVIGTAMTFANLQFGNIVTMSVISGGNNFTAAPSFKEQTIYFSDYTDSLVNTNTSLVPTYSQPTSDLGWIAGVRILNGGSGYSNTTDQIVVPSAIGYGAVFSFQTGTGGAITSVSVTNSGNGYFYFPSQLAVANSANTQNAAAGSGAVLVGYLYGQGANLVATVDQIGVIKDFYLSSRGLDYIAAPRVSMRNEDITIIDPGSNLVFVTTAAIYQGANQNSGTYVAYIDNYNAASHVLRVYDYQGNLNTAQNLIYAVGNSNVQVNTANTIPVVVYGNGQANANAIFVAGEQNQPGFYINTDGQPSADRYLQDANTYHNYSYKVVVEQALSDYKNTLMHLVHPAGTSLIGQFNMSASNVLAPNAITYVGVWPNCNGTVNTASYSTTGLPTNLLTRPSDFANTVSWTSHSAITVVPTTVPSPDSIVPVESMSETAVSGVHSVQQGLTIAANTIYTVSVYAKANSNTSGRYLYINLDNSSANGNNNGFFAIFDVVSGTANATSSGHGTVYANSITAMSNGWYYCTLSGIVDAYTTSVRYSLTMSVNTNAQWYPSYAGNVANTVYIWGAAVQAGNNNPLPYANGVIVQGTGTNFTANANANDLIVFNATDNTRKLLVKSIVAVLNTGNVQIDSNTSWIWDTGVNITNGSNLVVSSVNTANFIGNIAANDIITINANSNSQTAIVQNIINATAFNVNTVFSSTNNFNMMMVFPSINAAVYLIENQAK